VFGAGTVQWSWGLANVNAWEAPSTEPAEKAPDANMEQATVNLLAEMGAQPGTLIKGLVTATKSTDTTPPTSTITSPAAGAKLTDGSSVTITGTATDTGGGVVAGVEVSTNGGSTWHPATLTTAAGTSVSWSYAWVAHGNPTTTIESRAVDDSANIQTSTSITGTAKTVNVSCPCSIWGAGTTPTEADSEDPLSTEVGVKFTSSTYGTVSGIRFYKAAANTGTHIGSLWTSSGTLLAQATFTSETASGWQQVNFATPVAIQPNTTYVAGYLAPNGHYSDSPGYFYTPPPLGGHILSSPPLSAVGAGDTSTNGLYSYSATSTFPTSTFDATNYYVDVVFTPSPAPGTVTGVTATPGPGSANLSWTAPTTGGAPTTYTITCYYGSQLEATFTVTGSPPVTSFNFPTLIAGYPYTFKVQASNPNGSGPISAASNAVTPTEATAPSAPTGVSAVPATREATVSWTAPSTNGGRPVSGYTITPYIGTSAQTPVQASASATSATVTGLQNGSAYTFTVTATNSAGNSPASAASAAVTPQDTIFDLATPATVDSGETLSTEVGVKFTSSKAGSITGIRFYKAATNTGTHIGSLWTSAGVLLEAVTFTSETESGWQQANFATPVEIKAGETYVAAYLAPNGHYSVTSAGFATAGVTNGPLQALANTTSANGVFAYTSSTLFPTTTFNANNYFVDVMFSEVPPPGQVTNVAATAGQGSAALSWSAPSTGGPVTTYTVSCYYGSQLEASYTVTGSPPVTSFNFPGLIAGYPYTFEVQASNQNGSGPISAASNAVTPTAVTAPSAPLSVTAQPASSEAVVSWTPPASSGGSPITGYTIRPYVGTVSQAVTTVSASTTSTVIPYLKNGTPYTFTVAATNAVGKSVESAASSAVTPDDTIFDFATPTTVDSGDGNSTEVGVRFTASAYGSITGIRFYKAAANTGTHIGSLWTSTGTLLASATFTSETASGWQYAYFSTPVPISEGGTYVAAYLAPNGHYSASPGAFASAFNNPPLQALASGTSPNGLYSYSSTSTFPTNTINATNYYVDVMFNEIGPPGIPGNVTATASYESATVSWSAPVNGGPVGSYTITPYVGTVAQSPTTITGTPPATSATIKGLKPGTSYTFKVQASSAAGTVGISAASNAVTPLSLTTPSEPLGVSASPARGQVAVSWSAPSTNGGSAITGYTVTPYIGTTAQTPVKEGAAATSATITGLENGTPHTFTVAATNAVGTGTPSAATAAATPDDTILEFATPAIAEIQESASIELGVRFTSSVYGSVTGIRFYKASSNTGIHVGSLWTAAGQLIEEAVFTSESASGWQEVNFPTPVAITPGTTYVAAYLAPNGHYSVTPEALNSSIGNGPLQALASGASPNGVFSYGLTSTFPVTGFNGNNYFVDVMFAEAPPPGQVTNVTASAGVEAATVSWSAPSAGGPITTYTVTPYIRGVAQTALAVTGSPPATGATFTGLKAGTEYTFKVQASSVNGSGPVSAGSNVATPTALTAPSTPTNVSATPATDEALVSWTAPNSNGSPITEYTITPYIGTAAQTPVKVVAPASSATLSGLANGSAYTFTVTATNAIGTSPPSSPSGEIIPRDTIFDFAQPAQADSGDTSSTEVGVRFIPSVNGFVTGIRFYKAPENTGTHVGSLWLGETQLANATFTSETASGWQEVTFETPVEVLAGTAYVAAYLAPNGHYSVSPGAFATSAIANGPLQAPASTTAEPNGLYSYTSTSALPTSTYNGNNYLVDVMFVEALEPGQVTNVTATAGLESAEVSWSAPKGGGPITTYTVVPYIGSTAQAPTTVTGAPPVTSATVSGLKGGTEYTFKVQASGSNGAGAQSAASGPVTPTSLLASAPTGVSAAAAGGQALVSWTAPSTEGGSPISGYTITPYIGAAAQTPVKVSGSGTSATVTGLSNGTAYTFTVAAANGGGTGPASSASNAVTPQDTLFELQTPATLESPEASSTDLGVRFSSSVYGSITGIRFYKAAGNTGTHIGSLWTTSGELIAEAIFTSETASGWQEVNFASPVEITPGTTYVAAYLAPHGHYSVSSEAFAKAALSNGPLTAPANGAMLNGVFSTALTSTFPTGAANGNNYFVDVMFAEAPAPGQVTQVSAAPALESATVSWSAPSAGGPVTTYTVTPYIGASAQTPVTVSGTPPLTSATIAGLKPGTEYTFTVTASSANGTGATSAASAPMTPGAPGAPQAPTGVSATPAGGQALVSWSPPSSNGGRAITGYTVTPYIGQSAQAPLSVGPTATSATVTGLTDGTAYTFAVAAKNEVGTGQASAPSGAVTPADTIFELSTPATVDSGVTASTEIGVKFTASVYGSVTGIRYYKAQANTGTHIGSLWTASGTLLGEATFTSETASGWQEVNFSKPVEIIPGTTYVAAYLAPNGHYSLTSAAFATAGISNGPLQALANGTSPDGVYSLTSASAFPTSSLAANNYFVDVMFSEAPAPGQVTNVTATAGIESATVSWSAPATGGPVATYIVTPYIGASAQPATTVTGIPPLTSTTITGLKAGTPYSFTVQAQSPNGSGAQSPASTTATPSALAETAKPGDGQVTLSWTGPPASAGSPATVVASPGGETCTSTSGDECTVTGLTDGQTYSFLLSGVANQSVTVTATPYPAAAMSASNGLSLWLDGADPSTEYIGSACTGQTAQAGQSIGCWIDKSAGGGQFIQSSSAAQPSLGTLNGRPAINFTSSGQTQSLSSVATGTYQTVFVAAQSAATANQVDELFGQSNADFGIREAPAILPGPLVKPNANDWESGTGSPPLEWVNGVQATEVSLGKPEVIAVQSAAPQTIAATVGNYDLARGLIGQIGEIVAFKGTLTTAQREAVQSYLERKWESAGSATTTTTTTATTTSTSSTTATTNTTTATTTTTASTTTTTTTSTTTTPPVAPAITKQPSAVSVTEPGTATFSAAASGSPTPTVQWQVYTNADAGWVNIAGATSATYTTAATTTALSGNQYRAVFTNSAGSATTSAAVLTVTAAGTAPKITTQPSALTVAEGQPITFSAAASGTPTPTVQWQISTNGGSTWSELTGATSTTANLGAATASQNGALFRAVFTNSAGTATTNSALLTVTAVTAAPKVTTQPVSASVASGATATFTAAASGSPAPTVQWQLSQNAGSSWTNISGATSTSYTTGVTSSVDNGYEYRAVFTNSAGSATSSAAVLTVTNPTAAPKITLQPTSQTVGIFGTATFTAAASGTPTPTVQWQQSTNSGKTWTNISGATSTSYKVTSLFNNGYEFRAVFTNSAGSATTNAAKLTT
jgi:hypothetical protein